MHFGAIFLEQNDPFLNQATAQNFVVLIRDPGMSGMQSCIIDPPGFLRLDLGRSPGSKTTQMLTLNPEGLRFCNSIENVPGFWFHMICEVTVKVWRAWLKNLIPRNPGANPAKDDVPEVQCMHWNHFRLIAACRWGLGRSPRVFDDPNPNPTSCHNSKSSNSYLFLQGFHPTTNWGCSLLSSNNDPNLFEGTLNPNFSW